MFELALLVVAFVVSFILSVVLAPKPNIENARPAHLGDFRFPTATEGRVVPLVWGTVRLDGPNVVWYGDYHAVAQTKGVSSGLFSGKKQVITGYQYHLGIQFALCRGPVDFLTRIWVNTTKVAFTGQLGTTTTTIHKTQLLGGDTFGTGGISGVFAFYVGSTDQAVNDYLNKSPADFLWKDNFTLDPNGEKLAEYLGSDPQSYYRVSTADGFAPGTATHDTDVMVVAGSTTDVQHIRGQNGGFGAPGDLQIYNAMLMHPARPRLLDNISYSVTFTPKPASEDFGGDLLLFGCRVQDDPAPTEGYGLFVTITNTTQVSVVYSTPSASGTAFTGTSPTDFPEFLAGSQHIGNLETVGNTVKFTLDGVLLWTGTVPGLIDIPTTGGGFCVGFHGNIGQNFAAPTDLRDVGFYELTIDDLTRVKISNVPAYRGTCYGVLQRGYVGTSTSIAPWSFEVRRCVNGLALTDNKHIVNGFDANPMNVIYEILTNPDWGMSQSDADIDLDNFTANADTLFTEGNGFSFVLDSAMAGPDLIVELERQINGFLFVNRSTGKWTVTLARGDYVVGDLASVDESNVIEVSDFTRGSWDETSNNVTVEFANRNNSYGTTYALSQDMANVRVQDGAIITAAQKYPGVKDPTLASQIAWRDLKTLAYPLAKATLILDREFWDINPGDLFRWSDSRLNITDLPMRVTSVDLGQLENGQIKVDCLQDVFAYQTGSFSSPSNTQWVPIDSSTPGNVDPTFRIIFEAPLAFISHSDVNSDRIDRVWVGARDPGSGAGRFNLYAEENGDLYSAAGDVESFAQQVKLNADIGPLDTSFDIKDGADLIVDVTDTLSDVNARDIGRSLLNICSIGEEIIGFESWVADGDNITLSGVHRGLCDTVPTSHSEDDLFWFLIGNLTDVSFDRDATVGIKLLTESPGGILDISVASATTVTLNDRCRRPYPPTNLQLSGFLYPATASMDIVATASKEQFYTNATPLVVVVRDDITTGWEIGIAFSTTADGVVAGVRFYKGTSADGGTHIGNLWTVSGGTLIASVTFGSEPDTGWCTAFFDPPVAITSGTHYVLSYSAVDGHWTQGSTTIQRVTHDDLVDEGSVYNGTSGDFPGSGPSEELFVDVIFVPGTFTIDDLGLDVSFTRRDFRTNDEVKSASDELSLPADFPAANTTQYQVELVADPLGTPALLLTTDWGNAGDVLLSRNEIYLANSGVFPSTVSVSVKTRHTYSDTVVYQATQLLSWILDLTSSELGTLDGMGAVAPNTATNSYTAIATGTFRVNIGTALGSGNVQYQKNSDGTWHNVITSGTTGTFGVTSGDVLIFQHTHTGDPTLTTMMILLDAVPAKVAYALFILG